MPAIHNTTVTTVKVSLPVGLSPAELLYIALLLALVMMLGMLAGLLFVLYVVDLRPCPRAGGNHLPGYFFQTDLAMEGDSEPCCEHCNTCHAAWREGALRKLQQHFPNATILLHEKVVGRTGRERALN